MHHNLDLAHAIISPGQMTNPAGSSQAVTPVLAPTLDDLSNNNHDGVLTGDQASVDGVVTVLPQVGATTVNEQLMTSLQQDSANHLD